MATVTTLNAVRELRPRIVVFGVGGAGGNAVNNMIASDLEGVHFVVANTDAQALVNARAHDRIQLGPRITEGLGAGARPEIGARATEDSLDEIRARLEGAHMVFVTAGMGGGTGTGGAPIIAQAAREMGVLCVGVVTMPFSYEGDRRSAIAVEGLDRLAETVDTLIVVPNQNLFRVISPSTPLTEAFAIADEVLHAGVRSVTDLITRPGLINLDFADVRTIMEEMGSAMMGAGEAAGDNRACDAAHAAISNPLLDNASLRGARGVLINITGGADLTLFDVEEATNEIRAEVDEEATVIIGSAFDQALDGQVRVSVLATGLAEGLNSGEADGAARAPAYAETADAAEPDRETAPPRLGASEASERAGGGFAFFGRRRGAKDDASAVKDDPGFGPTEDTRRDAGDGGLDEAELEIPAFLRRQAG